MPTESGRNTGNYLRLAAQLRAAGERRELPCWLCRQPIHYDAPSDQPDALSVDHVQPLSMHPWLAEDPTNLTPSHRRCNLGRGNRPPPAGLDEGALLAVTVPSALPTAQNVFMYAATYDRGTLLVRDVIMLSTVLSVPVLVVLALVLG